MILSQLTSLAGVIAPPPGITGNAIAALQLFAIAGSYSNETSNPTPYSKFAADKKFDNPIPSQNGMFRIYVPSTIAAAIYTAVTFNSESFSLVSPLLFGHFLKRTLEVAFVHRYSGSMPATSANGIGGYYTFLTLLISLTAVPVKDIASQNLLAAGLVLFAVGELGNLYHHYLLSTLRSSKESNESKKYVPPTGGLFSFVAAPHYFFELVAWLGMACVAQQTNAFLTAACMASYLAGRAVKTNEIYQNKFSTEEWPESRKAIVPGIF